MDVHLGRAAAMPGRKQHAAAATLVRDVLEAVHDVRDAAQQAQAAKTQGPRAVQVSASRSESRCESESARTTTVVVRPPGLEVKKKIRKKKNLLCCIPRLERRVRHAPLPARRTVSGRWAASQTRNRRRVLVHGTRLLLRRHARLRAGVCFLLMFVRLRGLLLGWR